MAKLSKQKNQQIRVLEEIRKQLVLQAERWGCEDYYTPQKLEEMVLEQCYKIREDFFIEKANLEYEMQQVDSNKKECLIKLEKISRYLKKSDRVVATHKKSITRFIEKLVGDRKKTQWALGKRLSRQNISVLVGEN